MELQTELKPLSVKIEKDIKKFSNDLQTKAVKIEFYGCGLCNFNCKNCIISNY